MVAVSHLSAPLEAQDLDQDDGAGPGSLEFSFSNPGARAMGFGGAFAALADDATAALANPAGLIQLTRSEVSVEGRLWQYKTPFTEGGRVTGSPSGAGLDSTAGLRFGESSEEVAGLSFLSFVYPKKKWALAFYRHELARFEFESETQGIFGDSPIPGSIQRFFDRRITTDFRIESYGIAGAYRLTDRVSFGAGFATARGYANSDFETFLVDNPGDPDSFFAPISYLPEQQAATATLRFDESDVIFNLGLLWRLDAAWSLGAFYREGPHYQLIQDALVSGPGLEIAGLPVGTILDPRETTPIHLPDVWGLGIAYRSDGGAFTLSLEWDRVEYSAITNSFDPEVIDREVTLTDGDELHLGAEYVFAHARPIVALRLGAWLDPDHRFRFVAPETAETAVARALFRGGDDKVHLAAGLGLVFETLQIDVAVDLSDSRDTASISAIYSF